MVPRISIITPLYNKGLYIAETIQSVLSQTESNWELLVIDNLSTDDGFKVAQSFDDPRLKFLSNPIKGPGSTRNLGLNNATGDWILYLDADDLLEPDYLQLMLKEAEANPDAVVIASPWEEFRDQVNGQITELRFPAQPSGNTLNLEDTAIANTCWAIHAAITKRSWLKEIRWPTELDQFLAEDTAYWFRVVSGAKVAYTDYAGARYRTLTDDCRSDYNAVAWFEGNYKAMQSNIDYLSSLDRQPTAGQLESLVRLYSSLYNRAKHEGANEISSKALREATYWLSLYDKNPASPKFSMRVRSALGLKNFEALRALLHFLRIRV